MPVPVSDGAVYESVPENHEDQHGSEPHPVRNVIREGGIANDLSAKDPQIRAAVMIAKAS